MKIQIISLKFTIKRERESLKQKDGEKEKGLKRKKIMVGKEFKLKKFFRVGSFSDLVAIYWRVIVLVTLRENVSHENKLLMNKQKKRQ